MNWLVIGAIAWFFLTRSQNGAGSPMSTAQWVAFYTANPDDLPPPLDGAAREILILDVGKGKSHTPQREAIERVHGTWAAIFAAASSSPPPPPPQAQVDPIAADIAPISATMSGAGAAAAVETAGAAPTTTAGTVGGAILTGGLSLLF